MTLAKSSGVVGVKNLKVMQLLTDVEGSAPTFDIANKISILGIKSLKMSKKTKEVESRGDERLRDKETTFDSLDISWEHEEIPMDAIVMIAGEAPIIHTAAVAGTSPEMNQIIESSDAVGNYFKIECDSKRGSKGKGVKNVGVEIFKVQGSISYDFVGEGFAVCSFKGTAFACEGTIGGVAHPYRRLTFADGSITYA